MAAITIDGIVKQFGGLTVLQQLSLHVPDGAFYTLLGPSGCGKTTLLRCIAGFYEPDGGRLLFDRDDVTRTPPHRRDIGMVFQDYALFPDKTAFDNVAYGLRARQVARAEIARRVAEALDKVGLAELAARYPAQMSGGRAGEVIDGRDGRAQARRAQPRGDREVLVVIDRSGGAGAQEACCSRKRCASSAAMQPVPALVMAWR